MRRAAILIALLALAGCGSESNGDVVPRSAGQLASPPKEQTPVPAYSGDEARCRAFDLSSMRGQRFETAKKRARASGCDVRQAEIDGEPQVLTQDLVYDRVDVEVRKDRVVSVGKLPDRDTGAPAPDLGNDGP